jgi:Holliday junction resolvase RusA-like endonuclease
MNPINLFYTDEVSPYVRVGRERWTPRATRYLASKDALALAIRRVSALAGHRTPDTLGEWAVTVVVSRRTRRRYDLDNVVKAVMDAANRIVWEDDAQVREIIARKGPSGADHLAVRFAPTEGSPVA